MSRFRPWAFWRRLQYGTGFMTIVFLLVIGYYYMYMQIEPTCFDGIQNQGETGIDCGGPCTRFCVHEVSQPVVDWTKSFRIFENRYNVVSYVINNNESAGTPEQEYTFIFYDKDDQVIREVSGSVALPPDSIVPIFEGAVDMLNRELARTELVLHPAELWLPVTDSLSKLDIRYRGIDEDTDSRPRLDAVIENTTFDPIENVDVVAVIYDAIGTPLTASRTVVNRLEALQFQDIFFTWPSPIAQTVRTCEVPSDIMVVLDRSGSMAADGGDPPEPLESAKKAAQRFLQQVQPNDQVGYLSYATQPTNPIEQTLTNDIGLAQSAVASTVMGTDGIQYTDMGAAFRVALEELTSSRARANARKVIVFLSDGDVTRPVNPETGVRDIPYARQYALDNAQLAKDAGITIYTIGFGDFFLEIGEVLDRDVDLVKELATAPEYSYIAPTLQQLDEVYTEIAEEICEEGSVRVDLLPVSDYYFVPFP